MRLTTQRKVALGFLAATLVLGVIALAAVQSMRALIRSAERVNDTHRLIETLARVEQSVVEVETSQRGFMLTGDARFVASYRTDVVRVRLELDSLRRLAEPQRLDGRLVQLRELVARKMGFIEYTLSLYRGGQPERAIAIVRTGEGLRLAQEIRRAVNELEREATLRLESYADVADVQLREAGAILLLGFVVTLLIAAVANSTLQRDLRERDRLQRELTTAAVRADSANRAKSDFLARMSHELRTPLNSVIGFANVLRKNRGGALGAQELDFLERIQTNGQHLLGIINDILDLAKVESGRLELHVESLDLPQLARETARQFAHRAGHAPLRISVEAPDTVAPLRTDGVRLRQVLVNLVANAAKFSEDRPIVLRIVTAADGSPMRLDVIDHGIGIPGERLEAIFEAFEQAESSTTRRYGGTGLGLAISRQLSELLGFRLSAVSAVGDGSTFSILFGDGVTAPPRHEPAVRPGGEDGNGRALAVELVDEPLSRGQMQDALRRLLPAGGARVLVVDDDDDARRLLEVHLAELRGVELFMARDGREALALLERVAPQLVILDLMMPEMDGLTFLDELRRDGRHGELPVIVVTAKELTQDERVRLARGAQAVLEKDEAMGEDLRHVLDHLLHGRSASGSNGSTGTI